MLPSPLIDATVSLLPERGLSTVANHCSHSSANYARIAATLQAEMSATCGYAGQRRVQVCRAGRHSGGGSSRPLRGGVVWPDLHRSTTTGVVQKGTFGGAL